MSNTEIVALVIAILGIGCFSIIFTILYKTYADSTISDIKSGKKDIELIDEAIYDNLSHVKVRRKIIGTIKSIVFYGLMIFIIPFFLFSIINKLQGNVTTIGNRGVLVVASGSMSEKHPENTYLISENLNNQFDKFDIIVIERVSSASDLKKYDVISFVNDEGVNIIHRIVDIDINSEGEIEFTTRGDSNGEDAIDKFKPTIDDIEGRYIGKRIPLVGMFVLFMQSSLGMITIVGLVYCLIMVDRYTVKIVREQEKRLEKLNDAIDYDKNAMAEGIKASYVETIYYKGYIYLFNEDGFIDKQEIKDEEVLEKSKEAIIRIVEDKETNQSTSEEFIIENESEEE